MPAATRSARRATAGAVLAMALLVTAGGCTEERPATPDKPTATSRSSSTAPAAERTYVSLGDSYATGYRPSVNGLPSGSTREGFADLVAARAGLRLVNVACSGATAEQLRAGRGCTGGDRALDAPDMADATQLDAAVRALREHAGDIGLVTVVIGGNDVTPCALLGETPEAMACITNATNDVTANLGIILPTLRAAAGDAPIIGMTYPDVLLGAWVSTSFPDGRNLARLSVPLFNDFNDTIRAEYERIGATFVDVTEATGGYGPLTETTRHPTYGPIPTPVARVCALTYFCAHTDVHPTPAGHRAIADAVLAATGR